MNWKERYEQMVSSVDIKPKVGMRVKNLKGICGNNAVIGKTGTIANIIIVGKTIGVIYDEPVDDGHDGWTGDGRHRCWNGNQNDWNNGAYMVVKK